MEISNPPENTCAILKVLLRFLCCIWSVSGCLPFTILKASGHLWQRWPMTQQIIKVCNRNLPWMARNTYVPEIKKCNYKRCSSSGADCSGNYIWMDYCIQLIIGLWCRGRVLISYIAKWKNQLFSFNLVLMTFISHYNLVSFRHLLTNIGKVKNTIKGKLNFKMYIWPWKWKGTSLPSSLSSLWFIKMKFNLPFRFAVKWKSSLHKSPLYSVMFVKWHCWSGDWIMRARMSLLSFAYTLVMQILRTILRVEKFLFLLYE